MMYAVEFAKALALFTALLVILVVVSVGLSMVGIDVVAGAFNAIDAWQFGHASAGR